MKDILIIRSVSMQQMDLCFPVILERFEDCRINILTHEHGVENMKKYTGMDCIYSYPYKSGFDWRKKVHELKGKRFNAVIIPVTNTTGSSFENVILFGVTIKAKKYYILNIALEFRETSKTKVFAGLLLRFVFKLLSIILTIPFTVFGFVIFIISTLFSGRLFEMQR